MLRLEQRYPRRSFPAASFLAALALLLAGLATGGRLAALAAPAGDGAAAAYLEPLRKGEELRREGRFKKARRELEQADELAGGRASEVAAELARLALAEEDVESALAEAKRALDLAADEHERAVAWDLAGLVRLTAATRHEVQWQLQQSLTAQGRGGDPATAEQFHRNRDRELDRAEEAFEQALDLAPSDEVRLHLAQALVRHGDLAAAREELADLETLSRATEAGALSRCLDQLADDPMAYVPGAGGAAGEPEVTAPVKLEAGRPAFPSGVRHGYAVIWSIIDRSGKPVCVRPLGSSDPRLAEAAMAAVRDWRFQPATRDGAAVAVSYYLTVNFLRD